MTRYLAPAALAAIMLANVSARADDCSEFSSWSIGPAMRHSCEHLQWLRDDPVYRQESNDQIEAAIHRSDWERPKRNALIPHHDPGAVDLCPSPHRMTAQDGCQ
jgi:hypothetical protein